MRPPSRWLAPGAGTAMPPPPGRQEAAPWDKRAPPTPPPPATQAHERTEADRRNGGPAPPPKRPLHPGCGGTFDFTGHKMAKTRILSKWLTKLTHLCCVLSLF